MPTLEWLKKEFSYGYQSGDILSATPDEQRYNEEKKIGGSYHYFFKKTVAPLLSPNSRILELGPGAGSWTRALLNHTPEGEVHTCDFQDVQPWLRPEQYQGRLICHQVNDNSFMAVPDDYFDIFFSFGVLVHCNHEIIEDILANALKKVKIGGYAIHNYGDWEKLNQWGWEQGGIPKDFIDKPDNEIWWPRNNKKIMSLVSAKAGWSVTNADIDLFKRDGVIVLQRRA